MVNTRYLGMVLLVVLIVGILYLTYQPSNQQPTSALIYREINASFKAYRGNFSGVMSHDIDQSFYDGNATGSYSGKVVVNNVEAEYSGQVSGTYRGLLFGQYSGRTFRGQVDGVFTNTSVDGVLYVREGNMPLQQTPSYSPTTIPASQTQQGGTDFSVIILVGAALLLIFGLQSGVFSSVNEEEVRRMCEAFLFENYSLRVRDFWEFKWLDKRAKIMIELDGEEFVIISYEKGHFNNLVRHVSWERIQKEFPEFVQVPTRIISTPAGRQTATDKRTIIERFMPRKDDKMQVK